MRRFATAILFALSWVVSTPAVSAPLETTCGALVSTTVKTSVDTTFVGGNAFSVMIGAFVVVSVPAGTTRCVKVIFAPGETTCGTPNGCLVRGVANSTVPLHPANAQHVSRYHEWVRRLPGPGFYPLQIQIQPAGGSFTARNWVMEVQVFQ